MTLQDLQIGETARVSGYTGTDPAYRHKLLRMGLTKGTTFTLLRKAPLGDPVEIAVRGFNLTLRRKESGALLIEQDNGEAT